MEKHMRKLAAATLFAFSATIPAPALAGFETGNDVLSACRSLRTENFFDAGRCLGYVVAISDMLEINWFLYNRVDCQMPERVTKGQVADIVVAYLERNPGTRHQSAAGLVSMAIQEQFCANNRKASGG
ncbi:Rap1a/Tai family immunity protein [Ensifer sp. NPDC090286]|uniref:Rap1a/Tai family immunity protein n=1 Tax=Ensifer sp. NPDC090286 TaxID=3363991 RepID=UPI00383B912F